MDETLVLEEYSEEKHDLIVDLLTNVFDGWPKIDIDVSSVDYWKWKYLKNPLEKRNICYYIDDRIVACSHRIPKKCIIRDLEFYANQGADAAVDPAYRGRGLWNNLRDLHDLIDQRNGINFSYFITGNQIIIDKFNKSPQYQRIPHKLIPLVRIIDVDKHLKIMPMDNPEIVKIGYRMISAIQKTIYPSKKKTIETEYVKLQDINLNPFWEKIKTQYDFIFEKTQHYLEWRYSSEIANYDFVISKKEDEITGILVLLINRYRNDYPIGYILECLTAPDDTESMTSLLHEANKYFDKENVNIIQLLSINQKMVKCARENGYVVAPIDIHAYIQQKESTDSVNIEKLTTLYFSWGDHDSLPIGLKN